jgi:hypothetical protein
MPLLVMEILRQKRMFYNANNIIMLYVHIMHAVASRKGCFVSRAITKKDLFETGRKQTIQRSSTSSTQQIFQKLLKQKAGVL